MAAMKPLRLLPLAAVLFALPLTAFAQHGIAPGDMDTSVVPGDNFYLYANGKWQARTEIPADRAGISSFSLLADTANQRVATLIEDAAKSTAAAGTDERRVADLYASYMDEAAIEKRGTEPLKPQLAMIAAIKDRKELAAALGRTLRADVDALNNTNFHTSNLFGLWVAPGFVDSDHYTPYLMQGGLMLPDQAYYTGDSARMKSVRTAYQAHIAAMLKLAGFEDVDARAAKVVALETAIAKVHRSLAENEDIAKANNTWATEDFAAKAPGLDWTAYFAAAKLGGQKSFIVWQPEAFTGEAALVASEPLDAWKDYLDFHLIETYSGALPKAFADERFAFAGKILTGATQQRPRDQRAVGLVNGVLGEAVGKLYAARYFSPEEKAQVQALVANLLTAFRARLTNLTWMAPATKKEALAKLDTLQVGIGYPDHFRSYAGLEIKPEDLFGNLWRSSAFEYGYALGRIGKPVDRKEWCMTPQTVNAVNLPLDNGLNFPAAILAPPFYDPKAPAAYNYGAIGSVIGHEISHTFDSEGAAFDSKGRVRNWWTAEDLAHFNASTAALAKQYDAYKPFPDLSLNGKQTLGENIADLAGLLAAYEAYHTALGGAVAPAQAGFTGDQQFFLAFAQTRQAKSREAALRQQILTDPHSPGEWRTETVRNLDAWYPAFGVKPGETLYLVPADRVRIW